jgi:hypothetical protein
VGTEILVLSASITIVALVLAIIFLFIFRWKIAFSGIEEGKTFQIIPSGVVDKNTRSYRKLEKQFARFQKHQTNLAEEVVNKHLEVANQLVASDNAIRNDQEKTSQALQAVLSTVKALREETKILREEIQSKSRELERFRNGYDVDIQSTALIPIARMHRILLDDIGKQELPEEAKTILITLEDECMDVLETKGVRLEHPRVGERFRDHKNIDLKPAKIPTSDSELVGKIASVTHPSYELQTTARNVVLLPAVVEVYSVGYVDTESDPGGGPVTADPIIQGENNG